MTSTILAPAAVLVVMMLWVVVTRLPAFGRAGIDMSKADPGARYVDVESQLPDRVNWKSHNYTHLMEQPTLFYALVCIIALAGGAGTVNTVPVRFFLFGCSNVCLLVLTWQALRLTL